ncbi:hypothetical protein ABFX02_04G074300 [Erythranthe guttata]
MANKEGNSEILVGKCNSERVKMKNKSSTTIESLPDELVYNILVRLPAEDIYNDAMLVCWKWYRTIHTRNFIDSHLRHSTPGILVRNFNCKNNDSVIVSMKQDRVVLSEFSYKFAGGGPWSCCNGLIVEYDYSKRSLRITNPAIKRHVAIPQFIRPRAHVIYPSIAYSAASKEYKVVLTYGISDGDSYVPRLAILTVGVDQSWRDVCTPQLSEDMIIVAPFISEGFIHWPLERTHVLTLNVATEVVTQTPLPEGCDSGFKFYLSTGKNLSLFVRCTVFSLEVWDLESESGEWTKMNNIDLESQKSKFEDVYCKKNSRRFVLIPTVWLKCREVLVFRFQRPTGVFFAYNLRSHGIEWFELDYTCHFRNFELHTSSLVWLT